jgi:membrane associated rhomboid family serine protease
MLSNPLTLAIIGITAVTSIIAFSNRELFDRMKFNPFSVLHSNQYWRFFTYGLLHADWIHLFVNMWVLWIFGDVVEQYYREYLGVKWAMMYILLYVGGIMLSVLPSFGKHKNNPGYSSVGASGAVSSVLFASILFVPTGKIYLFLIPIGIPAFIFGVLYLVYSWYAAKRGRGNIGHDAHFWGAVFGVVFTIAAKPQVAIDFWSQIAFFLKLG